MVLINMTCEPQSHDYCIGNYCAKVPLSLWTTISRSKQTNITNESASMLYYSLITVVSALYKTNVNDSTINTRRRHNRELIYSGYTLNPGVRLRLWAYPVVLDAGLGIHLFLLQYSSSSSELL